MFFGTIRKILSIFFFSSRRRHTRYWRDWSSDVCSSDLQVRPRGDWHLTATAAVAVENSHNRGGGLVQPLEQLQALWDWSRQAGVNVHLDGARIWNASVSSGVDLATYGGLAVTRACCLYKGLGPPGGPGLVGFAYRIG